MLRDWFLSLKLPPEVVQNALAMEYWELALQDPTKGKIRAFCVLALIEPPFSWWESGPESGPALQN